MIYRFRVFPDGQIEVHRFSEVLEFAVYDKSSTNTSFTIHTGMHKYTIRPVQIQINKGLPLFWEIMRKEVLPEGDTYCDL